MPKKLLIANRGEIACRIINTARNMGIRTVAIASAEDRDARHGRMADQLILLDDGTASQNYLNISAIIEAAKHSRAQAIHPGYGFLSENPEFADAVRQAGIRFIGPSADTIRQMGLKDEAKRLMQGNGIRLNEEPVTDAQATVTLDMLPAVLQVGMLVQLTEEVHSSDDDGWDIDGLLGRILGLGSLRNQLEPGAMSVQSLGSLALNV